MSKQQQQNNKKICNNKKKFEIDRATLWVVGEGVTVLEIGAVAAMVVVVVKTIALHFSLKKTCFFRDRAILYAIKKIGPVETSRASPLS